MKTIDSLVFEACYKLKGELYLSPNVSSISEYFRDHHATVLVTEGSYAEKAMKKYKRSYAYAKTSGGVRTTVATPTPEPKSSGIKLSDIFVVTDEMQAIIDDRDARGDFPGYLVLRNGTNEVEWVPSREEAGQYFMIQEVPRTKEYQIWQYDLKSVQWGMTQEQIIAAVGCEPMVNSLFMIYKSNLFGYQCSVGFDFERSDTLIYGLFVIHPKDGQSLEDLTSNIQQKVEQKLGVKGKYDEKGRLIFGGKQTVAWIEPSTDGEDIVLHFHAP